MGASQMGYPEVAQLLIEAGADIDTQTKDGATALLFALEEEHTEIVELLRRAGAK